MNPFLGKDWIDDLSAEAKSVVAALESTKWSVRTIKVESDCRAVPEIMLVLVPDTEKIKQARAELEAMK